MTSSVRDLISKAIAAYISDRYLRAVVHKRTDSFYRFTDSEVDLSMYNTIMQEMNMEQVV